MKTFPRLILLILLACWSSHVWAQDALVERKRLSPEQIEELVGPIALYPDPLVALILPASTFPSDIVLAARYLNSGGLVENVASEPWDDSVRALARYREVIDYLDTHLAWTRSLGDCFLDQRDELMDAIQLVRARARTAGLLQDTPQQQVIVATEEIRIVPAEPDVIYVPRYDPTIIYSSGPYYHGYNRPFITFGIGFRVGSWLNFDCDWRSRAVRVVHRPADWYYRPDWRDHDRYRRYSGTNWVRRPTYPGHDRRFDRPTRSVSFYDARGADHRHASTPERYDGRERNGYRWDERRRASSPTTHAQMAREIQDRQRQQMDRAQERLTAPQVVAENPAVRAPGFNRQPDNNNSRFQRPDRADRPESPRRDHRDQPSERSRPERAPAQEVAPRSQPVVQSPPPPSRAEPPSRSEDRRRGNDDPNRFSRSGGRDYTRGDIER